MRMGESSRDPTTADGLDGHRYEVSRSATTVDKHAKTTRAIAEYVGKKFGHEMMILVLHQEETVYTVPVLTENASRQDELMWSKDYDLYLKKKNQYDQDKARVFMIVLGQCDETIKNRIEADAKYDNVVKESNVAVLIRMIKQSAFDSHGKEYAPKVAAMAIKQLASIHQLEDESLVQYYNRFKDMVERFDRVHGPLIPTAVAQKEKSRKTSQEKESIAREKVSVMLFMEGSHRGFRPLLRDFESDYTLGVAKYPSTLEEALQIMTVHEGQPVYKSIMKKSNRKKGGNEEPVEHAFGQVTKKEMRKKGQCFKCGKKWSRGHICEKTESDEVNTETGAQMTQAAWMI